MPAWLPARGDGDARRTETQGGRGTLLGVDPRVEVLAKTVRERRDVGEVVLRLDPRERAGAAEEELGRLLRDPPAPLATKEVDVLPGSARWWTNGDVALRGHLATWTPLSEATFDTGVIGVGDEHVLVAWFMDED